MIKYEHLDMRELLTSYNVNSRFMVHHGTTLWNLKLFCVNVSVCWNSTLDSIIMTGQPTPPNEPPQKQASICVYQKALFRETNA